VGLAEGFAPLQERRFRLLWLGRLSSAVGDALVPVALAFAVLSLGSPTALGGVLAAFMVTRVAFTLVGGVVADRLPRRAVMLTCDAVRAVVEAFTATMLLTHHMTLPLFFVTAALFGAASAFFGPASDGLVPQTVSPANLLPANALLAMSEKTMNVFGPAVSGVLIAVAGTGWVFGIDACTFVASAFFLLRLPLPVYVRAPHGNFLRELREGFQEVSSRPWVRAPIIGFAISNFCLAAFIVLGPGIFRAHLGGARNWGIVSACGAIGGILGSVASVRVRPHRPLTFGFVTTMLIGLPIAALAPPLPVLVIAAAFGFGMAAIALNNTYWETMLMRRIPASVFARVRSYDILVSFVFMPFGFVAFPLIAKTLGVETTLFAAGAVAAATSLAVAVVPAVRAVTDDAAVVQLAA
jgi:MFS family permease